MTVSNINYEQQVEKLREDYRQIIFNKQVKEGQLHSVEVNRNLDYRKQLEDMVIAYHKLPPPKEPILTIPAIFRKWQDEKFISDYLAYILHPRKNGIGIYPLEHLLYKIYGERLDLDADAIDIQREYPIDHGWLDLIVFLDDQPILVIENKIYAREGEDQTRKYHEWIDDHYEGHDCHFIFLTLYESKASSDDFKPLLYRELLDIIRSVECNWTTPTRQSILWQDFITHIKEYIIMEKSEPSISEQTKLYLANYSMMVDLDKSFRRDWPEIIRFIQLRFNIQFASLPQSELYEVASFPTDYRHTWQQVYRKGWSEKELSVHYEFHIGPHSFENGEFTISVDAGEGGSKYLPRFWQLLEQHYPELANYLSTHGFSYQVSKQGSQIVTKSFKFTTDLSHIGEEMLEALKEFLFLTEYIDQILKEMLS